MPMNATTAEMVQRNQRDRVQQIRNVCNYSQKPRVTAEDIQIILKSTNVIVDDKHKTLYCYVPKVGCTSWKVSAKNSKSQTMGG